MTTFFTSTRKVQKASRGFTLIELLLVLVILGILASVIVPRFVDRTLQAQIIKTKADIKTIGSGVEAFNVDNGRYPNVDEGLGVLIENIGELPGWHGPYIDYKPDPWENDYLYQYPSHFKTTGYDIISPGPDNTLNTGDDLHN